jgi:hypothetical protein
MTLTPEITVTILITAFAILLSIIGYLITQKDKDNKDNFDDLYKKMELLTAKLDKKYDGFARATTSGFSGLKGVMNDMAAKSNLDRQKIENFNKNCELMNSLVSKRLDVHERQIKTLKKIVADHDIFIKTKSAKDEK